MSHGPPEIIQYSELMIKEIFITFKSNMLRTVVLLHTLII